MSIGLLKSLTYLLVIILSYTLKMKKIFTAEHYQGITKLIMNLTLPCVVIAGFKDSQFHISMLLLVILGIVLNIILSFVGIGTGVYKGKDAIIFNSLIYSGLNIGCFSLPLIQAYMPTINPVPIFLFDIGNAIMSSGGTYAAMSCFKEPPKGNKVVYFLKRLTSSLPFNCYVLMLIISMLQIKLPDFIFTMCETIGSANAILAMFMLGGAMEISFRREIVSEVAVMMAARYLCSGIFAFFLYRFAPFELAIRQVLALLVFAPASVMAVILVGEIGLDKSKASLMASVSIPVSMVFTTLLIKLFHLG